MEDAGPDIETVRAAEPSAAFSSYCDYPAFSTSVAHLVNGEGRVEALAGVLKQQVWLKTEAMSEPVCLSHDVLDDRHATVALVKEGNDLYTFLGFWRSKELWAWRNQTPLARESIPDGARLKGLGGVALCKSLTDEEKVVFILGTGLGIGVGNLWKLTWPRTLLNAQLDSIGSIQGQTSITSIQFSNDASRCVYFSGQMETPTVKCNELVFDATNGEVKKGQSMRISRMNEVLGSEQLGEVLGSKQLGAVLLKKENAYRMPNRCLEGMESFTQLFPLRLLFEDAYEGEVNQSGEPHGYGIQFINAEGLEYQGQWRNGRRHGKGKLLDPHSQQVVFDGNFSNGERCDIGTEYKDKETYIGMYANDVRHGFGSLSFLKPTKLGGIALSPGATCRGFFKNGKLHGWSRISFPLSQFPASRGYTSDIACIAEFQTGVCLAEFWFHFAGSNTENRLDHCPKEDVNETKLIARGLSLVASEKRYQGPRTCWVCLGQNALKCCDECGFAAHSGCYSKSFCPFDVDPWSEEAKKPATGFKLIDIASSKKLKLSAAVYASSALQKVVTAPSSAKQEKQERGGVESKAESDALEDHSQVREREFALVEQEGKDLLSGHRTEEVAKRRQWKRELEMLEESLKAAENELAEVSADHASALGEGRRVFLPTTVRNTGDDELARYEAVLKSLMDDLLVRLA